MTSRSFSSSKNEFSITFPFCSWKLIETSGEPGIFLKYFLIEVKTHVLSLRVFIGWKRKQKTKSKTMC